MVGSFGVEAQQVADDQYQNNDNEVYGDGPGYFLLAYKVVPGVMNQVPSMQLFVYYQGGAQVYQGSSLPVQVMMQQPVQVSLYGVDTRYKYTITAVDPDYPSTDNPTGREYLLWLLTNVEGSDLVSGDIQSGNCVVPYEGPNPQKGNHRVVFIIYQQFYQPVPNITISNRTNFSARIFANQYSLGEAIAAVFSLVQPAYVTAGGSAGNSSSCSSCAGK